MRTPLCFLIAVGLSACALAQDQVSIAMNGLALQTANRAFAMRGDATISGWETAVLSGGGVFPDSLNPGQNTGPVTGLFTLIFPSGGIMTGNFTIPAGILIPAGGGFTSAETTFNITGGTGKYEGARGTFRNLEASGTAGGSDSASFRIIGSGKVNTGFKVLSQLAFGGGWYSALYFTSNRSGPLSFPVNFFADNGTPLIVPSQGGSTANVTLPAGGSVRLDIPNSGSLTQGYATVVLPEGVTGYGVFRQSVNGIQDQEAVVPLSNGAATSASLTFDDSSFITAVAIVNPSPLAATVTVTAKNAAGGVVGTGTVSLAASSKSTLTLRTIPGLSGVAGNRGLATFTVNTGSVAVLGLRFFGSAFTSIPTTEP
jgi:hypothetical protein